MTQSSGRTVNRLNAKALRTALEVVPEALRSATLTKRVSHEDRMRQVYLKGDHWQNSSGWRGPLPQGTPQEVIDEIAKYFTSTNKIAEIADRHLDAVIGLDPKWSWVTTRVLNVIQEADPKTGLSKRTIEPVKEEEKKRIDRLNQIYTEWIDRREIFWRIRDESDHFLWHGTLLLRMFIPPRYLSSDSSLKLLPFDQALDRIRVMVVDPSQGMIVYDESGEPIGSVYKYTPSATSLEEQIEYSWVDYSTGITHLFTYRPRLREFDHLELNLGGRLMMFEMRSKRPFISDSLIQLNAQMNVALTMAGRNVVQGGFLERVLINADLPGKYVTVPDGMGGTREIFVPDDIVTGPNSFLALSGQQVLDPETGEPTGQRMSPSMQWKDPVSVATFEQSARMFENQMYSESRQRHAQISGDAVASGVSRQQALQDFAMSINPTTRHFAQAFRWLFETSARLSLQYSNEKIKLEDLKVDVQCRLGTKFLSAEEQNLVMTKIEKKVISRETGMLELGIENPDAEKALIKSEESESAEQNQAMQGLQNQNEAEKVKAIETARREASGELPASKVITSGSTTA